MNPMCSLRQCAICLIAHLSQIGAENLYLAVGRLIHGRDQMQQRGFARAGGPHEGHEIAAVEC